MLDETERFRIPKISVPVVCTTIVGQTVVGEIFLDIVSTRGHYGSAQVLEFFNNQVPFFPIRTTASNIPILMRKQAIVRAQIPEIAKHLADDTAVSLAKKKDAKIHFSSGEAIQATIILDLPEETSRILDLVNQPAIFFPALVEEAYALINSLHVYTIEEL